MLKVCPLAWDKGHTLNSDWIMILKWPSNIFFVELINLEHFLLSVFFFFYLHEMSMSLEKKKKKIECFKNKMRKKKSTWSLVQSYQHWDGIFYDFNKLIGKNLVQEPLVIIIKTAWTVCLKEQETLLYE